MSQNEKVDVHSTKSQRSGLAGLAEGLLRRFQGVSQAALILPLYAVGCAIVGAAVVPGLALMQWIQSETVASPMILKLWANGSGMAAAYMLYGFSLLLLAPLVNLLLGGRLSPWRGPYNSLPSIRWYIHNGATYIMRYTFLEFLTPSPFNIWFYRLMGMKIGAGTIINSTHISDPSLITMGKRVTIGGSCVIVAHYGQGGYLVLAPVTIGDNATVGLRATIMGGVSIGANAKILPNSVVLPKTNVPDGETWGGVPAKPMAAGSSDMKIVGIEKKSA